ncbi:MAG: AraC family transcriptional regulator [Bacteroidota bacterium]|nr:AraC family transcriptional regulator [Bacteroidota bacterium]
MNLFLLENILLILTGIIGIIVVSIMLLSIKSNRLANSFLIVIFLLVCSRFLILGSYNLKMQSYFQDYSNQYKVLLLLIIPVSYLYYKTIIEDQEKINLRNLLHFIFPAIHFTAFCIIMETTIINKTFFVSANYLITLCYGTFYLMLTYNLLRKKLWTKKTDLHMDHFKLIRNWTIFLFSTMVILILRLFFSITYEFIYKNEISGNHFSYIFATIVWLLIFLKIIISPEILLGMPKLKERVNSFVNEKVSINRTWRAAQADIKSEQDLKLKDKIDQKIMKLIKEIDSYSNNQHFFRDPKVSIADLARQIGVPASYIAYMFKYHSNATFLEYKTMSRIEDAIKLIEKGYLNSNTLESLASKVGFASYNPFFTAFKKSTGLGPNDFFLKSLKTHN